MRIVIALGGNALMRKDQPQTVESQRSNVRLAVTAIAEIASDHELVISHGNGPQVGLLALQAACHRPSANYPLDVLGAESEGMIGYMIEQELGNLLPFEQPFATLLTMVEVDSNDPAFDNPTKPIGPEYDEKTADTIAALTGWTFSGNGGVWRRVVPSPLPKRIFEIRPIRWLLEKGAIVICAGGGGIPTVYDENHNLMGADVVIDKDRASALLADEISADLLVLATDVDGVYRDWGTNDQKRIEQAAPQELSGHEFSLGSMGPKVEAACDFVNKTGNSAVIGSLNELAGLLAGTAGTMICNPS